MRKDDEIGTKTGGALHCVSCTWHPRSV